MIARILVTGSREFDAVDHISCVLTAVRAERFFADAVLVHGGARGADTIAAEAWKAMGGKDEPVKAKWGACVDECPAGHRKSHKGRSWCPTAGIRRNAEMVRRGADLCLAFVRDGSRGTRDCMTRARDAGIAVRVFDYDNPMVGVS
jgi:hypothetical protein